MTNREKLRRMAIYDLLCRMQENLEQCNIDGETPCVMNSLGADNGIGRCIKANGECRDCIATWLNEEVKSNA